MSNGFEEARAQRNLLERLAARIPGFRGFSDRELRREVDRLQRESLAREVGRAKSALRRRARDYTDAGQIGVLHVFERLDRRLDGLSQSIRFADYGASGLFDTVKIGEPELERLYQFDLGLLDDLGELAAAIDRLPAPGAGDVDAAAAAAAALTDGLSEKWSRRGEVVSDVVRGLG